MTEKTAKRIEKLLVRLLAKLDGAELPKRPESQASVSSVTKRSDGTVSSGDDADVPSQLESTMVEAGPMRRHRIVVRPKGMDPRGE